MYKIILIILLLFLVARYKVFPLSAGTVTSGIIAAKTLEKHKRFPDKPFVAAIVEPREKNLIAILDHYIENLPYAYFQVYHGTKNKEILEKYKNLSNIELINLEVDNLTIQGYNRLLTSKSFWESIRSENCLIFQTDSITCNSQYDMSHFLQYDYVGAPSTKIVNNGLKFLFLCRGYLPKKHYMNGGLSFRKRSKMLKVIKEHPWDETMTEDVWFCQFLDNLPDIETARKFSFESEELIATPFGLHKPRKNYDRLDKLCPNYKKIETIPAHTDYRNLFLL